MKIKLLSVAVVLVTAVVALAQDKPQSADDTTERAIAAATRYSHIVIDHQAELSKLRNTAAKSKRPLPSAQSARLKELETEYQSAIDATRKVIVKLHAGESVFAYPGLLAIAPLFYNADAHTYAFQLQEGYSSFEGVADHLPDYFVVTFDLTGRITETHRYRTVDELSR